MKKNKRNKNGFSLIELIVVMGLISLVLTLAFSIYTFSSTIFRDGNRQNDLQSETRLAIENLMSELRYATFIQLIDKSSVPTTISSSYEAYIFYDQSTDFLIKRTSSGDQKFPLNKNKTDTPLKFTIPSPYMISYSLSVINDRQNFNISSEVSLLNIKQKFASGLTIDSAGKAAIKYQTPELFISEMQYPDVMTTSENDENIVVLKFSRDIMLDTSDPDTIIVEPGATAASKKLKESDIDISTEAREITFEVASDANVDSFVANDKIQFVIQFYGLNGQEYDAIYTIVFVGGSTKAWTVE